MNTLRFTAAPRATSAETRGRRPLRAAVIEPLEARIAPAAVITFTDTDGDLVTVSSTKGTAADLTAAATIVSGVLQKLDLTNTKFAGAAISITGKPQAGDLSDGLAHVGLIAAAGNDLLSVTIDGDLGAIVAGDGNRLTPAVGTLKVGSLGTLGTTTQAAGGNLASVLNGRVGSIVVAGDWVDATLDVQGNTGIAKDSQVGAIKIGGDFAASGLGSNSTLITVEDGIGQLTIRGSIRSAGDNNTAVITAGDEIGVLSVGGSIIGNGTNSSLILAASLTNGTIGGSLVNHSLSANVAGLSFGSVGKLTIQGSLLGDPVNGMGSVNARVAITGNAGSISVGGNIIGSGQNSGQIKVGGSVGSLTLGGSLIGGSGSLAGNISIDGALGSARIGGSIIGGAAAFAGSLNVGGKITSLTVGGSVLGGSAMNTGDITTLGSIQNIAVGGDLRGGDGGFSGRIIAGAFFTPGGAIGTAKIGGSIIGGSGTDTGEIFASDRIGSLTVTRDIISRVVLTVSIHAGFDIGSLTVGGSVEATGGAMIFIIALGAKTPTAGKNVAIGKVSIGGSMRGAALLAGYDTATTPMNGDAQIGTVKIGGDLAASVIAAGVSNNDGDALRVYIGNGGDQLINTGTTTLATIASVTVGGTVRGTISADSSADYYGIVAEEIKAVKIGGNAISLKPGPHNDPNGGLANAFVGLTGDFRIREL